jgi:hypothetical protein
VVCPRQPDYPAAARLLITADAGGSNGYRYRVWKSELAALAAETGLTITVCHFPPGTSKWNKIEHRLFSHTLNWRGRPLTSHEVVVNTIASTRTGLRVEAALDTGDYPTGIAISKQRFAALPLQRHAVHGTWNYTLHPQPATTEVMPVSEQDGPASRRQQMLRKLTDPRLTGMPNTELDQLSVALAPAQAARTQQRYAEQRGGRARRATGKLRGSKPLFDDTDRVLLTLICQRQVCSMNLLADLLEVSDACIGELVKETREVLEDHGHHAGAASVRFGIARDLLAFLDQDIRPARTAIIEALSDPALTGMSRDELHNLTERLAPRQAAHAERLTHQCRRGPRQPGARGGVFPQKISNSERVLLIVLYQRKLCTLDVLADALGDVSRSAVAGVVRETRPLLEQDGCLPAPASVRYRTAAELLATASAPSPTGTDTPTS